MNIELVPVTPTPETQHQLVVNGQKIGRLEVSAYSNIEKKYWHAIIDAKPEEGHGLYQGHGITPEEAIRNTIIKHREYAHAQLKRLDDLESTIFGKEADNESF